MNYRDYTNKYNGKYVDYDHAYGNQCTDNMRQFCKDVLNVDGYIAIPPRGNAKDIFRNFKDNQFLRKVLNTPTGVPKQGDIIFFNTYPFLYGWAGHVGIVDSADLYNLILFEQNYPTGSTCRFGKHNYKGCAGWLTPR